MSAVSFYVIYNNGVKIQNCQELDLLVPSISPHGVLTHPKKSTFCTFFEVSYWSVVFLIFFSESFAEGTNALRKAFRI